ncbi:MAG: hypothetical protein RLN62_03935 [Rickettsiales bacterium]
MFIKNIIAILCLLASVSSWAINPLAGEEEEAEAEAIAASSQENIIEVMDMPEHVRDELPHLLPYLPENKDDKFFFTKAANQFHLYKDDAKKGQSVRIGTIAPKGIEINSSIGPNNLYYLTFSEQSNPADISIRKRYEAHLPNPQSKSQDSSVEKVYPTNNNVFSPKDSNPTLLDFNQLPKEAQEVATRYLKKINLKLADYIKFSYISPDQKTVLLKVVHTGTGRNMVVSVLSLPMKIKQVSAVQHKTEPVIQSPAPKKPTAKIISPSSDNISNIFDSNPTIISFENLPKEYKKVTDDFLSKHGVSTQSNMKFNYVLRNTKEPVSESNPLYLKARPLGNPSVTYSILLPQSNVSPSPKSPKVAAKPSDQSFLDSLEKAKRNAQFYISLHKPEKQETGLVPYKGPIAVMKEQDTSGSIKTEKGKEFTKKATKDFLEGEEKAKRDAGFFSSLFKKKEAPTKSTGKELVPYKGKQPQSSINDVIIPPEGTSPNKKYKESRELIPYSAPQSLNFNASSERPSEKKNKSMPKAFETTKDGRTIILNSFHTLDLPYRSHKRYSFRRATSVSSSQLPSKVGIGRKFSMHSTLMQANKELTGH